MIFEYVLRKNGIDPEKDINLIQNIDFANTAGAFTGGTGDFTVEFEPNATSLENEGEGYVVASLGVESGYVPYTTYCAKQSYLKENSDLVKRFVRAIAKGQQYVNSHGLNSVWTYMLYSKTFWAKLPLRLLTNVIECPIKIALLMGMTKLLERFPKSYLKL